MAVARAWVHAGALQPDAGPRGMGVSDGAARDRSTARLYDRSTPQAQATLGVDALVEMGFSRAEAIVALARTATESVDSSTSSSSSSTNRLGGAEGRAFLVSLERAVEYALTSSVAPANARPARRSRAG